MLRPAIDGGGGKAGVRLYAVQPGLTFHGLRHSHKTWLIAGERRRSHRPAGWGITCRTG